MHLTQLSVEALLGERVPQKTEQINTRVLDNSNQQVVDIVSGSNDEPAQFPSMHLLMEPVFDWTITTRPEPIAINVNMTLRDAAGDSSSRFASGQPLLTLPLMISTVPSARYDAETNPVSAYDSQGQAVPLAYRDEDLVAGPRVWYLRNEDKEFDVENNTEIVISFTAPYRKTDSATKAGTRVDLRRDVSGGGLMGQGVSFLPIPPPPSRDRNNNFTVKKEGSDGSGENWNVTLEWDLTNSPPGTRGAWSFGDTEQATTIGSLDTLISHAVFAVGYLQRFPDWDSSAPDSSAPAPSPSSSPPFQVQAPTYWFNPSPYDMTALATQSLESYTRLAHFFNTTDTLRVFVRRIETGWGGTGASQSFLLEYSDETPYYADSLSLADTLAHETVHEFALLDEEPSGRDPSWQEDQAAWYVEGVASYVGNLVGLNGKKSKRGDLLQVLQNNMQAYYTAPRQVVEMDYGDVLTSYWNSTVDVVRVSYFRGFVFLAQLDGMIWKATDGQKSIDDVILGLYRLRVEGKPNTIGDLKRMISDLVGTEAFNEAYAAFFRGDLIVPDEDCLKRHGLKLTKTEWHRFELGFETESLRAFNVSGLIEGSNAEKAGVREGDQITKTYMLWTVEDSLDGKMKITILRDGQEMELEWVPRSDEIVDAYGWVEIDDDDGDPAEL